MIESTVLCSSAIYFTLSVHFSIKDSHQGHCSLKPSPLFKFFSFEGGGGRGKGEGGRAGGDTVI